MSAALAPSCGGQKEEGSRWAKSSELCAASSGHDTIVVKKTFAPFL